MAIKVIKAGTPPIESELQVSCANCGCLFECAPSDFRMETGDASSLTSVPCPTCKLPVGRKRASVKMVREQKNVSKT